MGGRYNDLWIRNAHEGAIWPLGFGTRTDGTRVVVSSGGPESPGLALWDAHTGELKWRGAGASGAFGIALVSSQAGVDVAVATEDGISLLDGATGEAKSDRESGRGIVLGDTPMWGVAAGALSSGTMFIAGAGHDGAVYRWSADTGFLLGNPMLGHGISVKGIDIIGSGQAPIIVSGDEQNIVYRWNADTGEQVGTPLRTGGERIAAGFTPKTTFYFASVDYDGNVRVWNAITGLQIGRTISAGGYPTGLALFDSDDSLNVVLANDAGAVVGRWDVETGRYLGDIASGYSVAGGLLAANIAALAIGGTDGSIRIVSV